MSSVAVKSPTPFVMPAVSVGMIVLWYENGAPSVAPRPALVTRATHRNLSLNVFDPQNQTLMLREGVRHMDDPEAREGERWDDGAWDFTEETRQLREWQEMVKMALARGGIASQCKEGNKELKEVKKS